MAIDLKEVRWLAGLLEGEGTFVHGTHKYPNNRSYEQFVIQVCMTDEDPIQHAATIMGGTATKQAQRTKGGKPIFRTAVQGPRAIGWMQTLYPLMGKRRRAKIAECLEAWKKCPGRTNMTKYTKRWLTQEVAP